ncbi:hypothetical protein [Streptomyces bobili]|uniref:hypothetical protein n=1 Tax=Streptomyces bobili TaxID=67280 RepID=UPI003F4DEB15
MERAHRDTGEYPRPTTDGPALRNGAEPDDDATTDRRAERRANDRTDDDRTHDDRTHDDRTDDDRITTHHQNHQNHLPEGAEQ